MNSYVASRYAERVQRLAAGLEPVDAHRASRIVPPLAVAEEAGGLGVREWTALGRERRDPSTAMPRLTPHTTCRHVLLYRDGLWDAADPRVTLRLFEADAGVAPRRYVPRRLSVPLVDPDALEPGAPLPPQAAGFRIWRPHLFAGAAYPVHETATGLRGRVERGGESVRWARVEATNADDEVVGRAHGDDRGEFLLLFDPAAAGPGDPRTTIDVTVTVRAPAAAPAADDLSRLVAEVDPLWDLPVEALPVSVETDAVSRGEVPPDGYTTERSWLLEGVPMGRISSDRDAFEIA